MSTFAKRVLAALITLTGAVSAAHAEATTLTDLSGGGSLSFSTFQPITLSGLSGSGSLTFSQDLLNALNVSGVNVTPVGSPSSGTTPISSGVKLVSGTGSVTVTDLQVDLNHKLVYASVMAGNQTTPTTIALLDVGNTSIAGTTPLTLSPQAHQLFQQTLSIDQLNFGAISSNITVTAAVPEPATYVLLGMGLLGLGLAKRRQRA